MLSFIHAADLHLGASFSSYPKSFRPLLIDHQFKSLESLVRQALELKVDAILFAGDLFDNPQPGEELITRLENILVPLKEKGIPFYLALGNHDAGLDRAIGKRLGLVIMDSQQATVIENQGWTLVGLSFEDQWDLRDPLKVLPKKEDKFTLGLFHSGPELYLPLSRSQADELAYDYLALGHVHSFTQLSERAFYSGNLAQLDGPPGFIYYRLDQGPSFIALEGPAIKKLSLDVRDLQQTLGEIEGLDKEGFYQLVLQGKLVAQELKFLRNWLEDRPNLLIEDRLSRLHEFSHEPVYTKTRELLETSPEKLLPRLELLEIADEDRLAYLEENRDLLLDQLSSLFRGDYD